VGDYEIFTFGRAASRKTAAAATSQPGTARVGECSSAPNAAPVSRPSYTKLDILCASVSAPMLIIVRTYSALCGVFAWLR
jgi:hypothetical protein